MELGLGKPSPTVKLLTAQSTQLTQIPSLERQNAFVENVSVGGLPSLYFYCLF